MRFRHPLEPARSEAGCGARGTRITLRAIRATGSAAAAFAYRTNVFRTLTE